MLLLKFAVIGQLLWLREPTSRPYQELFYPLSNMENRVLCVVGDSNKFCEFLRLILSLCLSDLGPIHIDIIFLCVQCVGGV